jgi:hypothetical protein
MKKVIKFIVAAFNEGRNGGREFPQTQISNWR